MAVVVALQRRTHEHSPDTRRSLNNNNMHAVKNNIRPSYDRDCATAASFDLTRALKSQNNNYYNIDDCILLSLCTNRTRLDGIQWIDIETTVVCVPAKRALQYQYYNNNMIIINNYCISHTRITVHRRVICSKSREPPVKTEIFKKRRTSVHSSHNITDVARTYREVDVARTAVCTAFSILLYARTAGRRAQWCHVQGRSRTA